MIQKFLSIFKTSQDSFEGKAPDERVLMVLRRHRFTIYTKITAFVLALLVPIFGYLIFYTILKTGGYISLFVLLSALWYLIFTLLIFYALTLYTLNVVIITDKRIIDNNQLGLWTRKISELHVSRIQDIAVETKGLIQTTLKFGDLAIQTAGSEKQFIFEDIPHPEVAKDVVMKLLASNSHGVRTI